MVYLPTMGKTGLPVLGCGLPGRRKRKVLGFKGDRRGPPIRGLLACHRPVGRCQPGWEDLPASLTANGLKYSNPNGSGAGHGPALSDSGAIAATISLSRCRASNESRTGGAGW